MYLKSGAILLVSGAGSWVHLIRDPRYLEADVSLLMGGARVLDILGLVLAH